MKLPITVCAYALMFALNAPALSAIIEFSNSSAITIPGTGTSGNANPFPSTINVSGISSVLDVDVTLLGLSHTFSQDLEIIIVGPGGQRIALMVDTGGGNNWTNDDVSFSDGASAMNGSSPGNSGTFSPTGAGSNCGITQCTGAGNLLSAFNGVDPNGAWNLYINDDAASDTGNLATGWGLTFDATLGLSASPNDVVSTVPEPATLALLAFGLAGIGFARRRNQR